MTVPLPPMPATMPMIVFLHPADDGYVRLRGGDWFDMMRDIGFQVVTSTDIEAAGGGFNLPSHKPVLAFSSIEGDAENVDALLGLAALPGSCVLVDVCGPFWDPDQLLGPESSREFWSAPAHQKQAARLLTSVDGLTTPHAGYVEALMQANPNVFLLPDVPADDEDDDEGLVRFGRALMLAWHTAGLSKPPPCST